VLFAHGPIKNHDPATNRLQLFRQLSFGAKAIQASGGAPISSEHAAGSREGRFHCAVMSAGTGSSHVFSDTLNSGRPLSVLDMATRSIDLHREIEFQVSGKSQQATLQ
jgi:hypothetical protein